ncbi:MAG: hypothetical protein ACRDRI_09380 [Pseudonocardiaceae bacterium]
MKNYTAHVTRDGRFWLVHIPEIDRHTQARNLREIDVMARDLVAIMERVEPDSFELTVDITMPGAAAEHLRRAEHLRAQAARAQADAAAEVRAAAAELRGSGIPLRDVGKLLGVSHQRADQLTKQG